MKNNANIVIAILVLLVLVLGSVVAYTFAVKPFISGYVTKTYNQGAADALSIILGQVQQQGYVEIPLGNGKSALNLRGFYSTNNSCLKLFFVIKMPLALLAD